MKTPKNQSPQTKPEYAIKKRRKKYSLNSLAHKDKTADTNIFPEEVYRKSYSQENPNTTAEGVKMGGTSRITPKVVPEKVLNPSPDTLRGDDEKILKARERLEKAPMKFYKLGQKAERSQILEEWINWLENEIEVWGNFTGIVFNGVDIAKARI